MNRVEVEKVANGYVVRPPWSPSKMHQEFDPKDIYVFETFEALSKFLKDQFEFKP